MSLIYINIVDKLEGQLALDRWFNSVIEDTPIEDKVEWINYKIVESDHQG